MGPQRRVIDLCWQVGPGARFAATTPPIIPSKPFMLKFPLALLALAIAIFAGAVLSPQHAQRRLTEKAAEQPRSPSSKDVFLKLAGSVNQTAPAKRLLSFAENKGQGSDQRYWAIVDFNQPSTKKRFYVFDTKESKVEAFYVSHGRGSEGANDDAMAEVFLNEDGSNSSSLGIYVALDEYTGDHGRSMRLQGLEPTNSNALSRAIVLHRADYVSDNFIKQTGRIGRSEGCFAVENAVADNLIDKLKNDAYIIAWKK